MIDRRHFLGCAAAAATPLPAAESKPLRGIFIILATPYTAAKAVDYDDLAREVDFLDRCGVDGFVWPQVASEYSSLSKDERMRGMEVIAKAARGKRAALVFGIQAPELAGALEYGRHAESLGADAVISTPPGNAKSVDDVRAYYTALLETVKRPFVMQPTGGPKNLVVPVDTAVSLARAFPGRVSVKEEQEPLLPRMQTLLANRPPVQSVFSGNAGRNLLHEMSMGLDGNMPGGAYADIYAQIWQNYHAGRRAEARDLFARLLLLITLAQSLPNLVTYMFHKRGVFKTAVSRVREIQYTPAQVEEIDFHFAALKPFLRA